MRVLQLCDYAAKYRGNFIESLNFLKENYFASTDEMFYAFPERMKQRNNRWYTDFEKCNSTMLYPSDEVEKIKTLRAYIKKNAIDIVHTHFTNLKTDACVDLACLGLNVKKIKHYRSSFGRFGTAKRAAAALCYQGWQRVLCVSPHVAAETQKNIPSCRAEVLNDAVYFPRLDEGKTLEKSTLGIPNDATVFLAIGYDYKLKGLDLACKAVEKIRERHNAYLAICVASNNEKIKEQITEDFGTFPEWARLLPPRQDIAAYYGMCDAYIQASRSEGFCYAIVEAAYCGKIVIASDCAGMMSHAENNFDFLWFKNGDENDLAERLETAIVKKDDIELIEKNRRSAVEKYGMSAMCENLYRLYTDIID